MRDTKKKLANAKSVVIQFDGDEYRVPGPAGNEAQAYYTDDKTDAAGTAKMQFKGQEINVTFRRVQEFKNRKDSKEFREGYDAGFSGKSRVNPYHNNTNHSATPEQQGDWLTGYVYGSNAKAQNKPHIYENAAAPVNMNGKQYRTVGPSMGNQLGKWEVKTPYGEGWAEVLNFDIRRKLDQKFSNSGSFQNGCSKAAKEIENKAKAAGLKFGNSLQATIKKLEAKGFHGLIDKLKRREIDEAEALSQLAGNKPSKASKSLGGAEGLIFGRSHDQIADMQKSGRLK